MTYAYQLNRYVDVQKLVALTVGTDGITQNSNLMSVSVVGPTEDLTVGTVYVAGANSAKAYPYTEVSPDRYLEHMMSTGEARACLQPVLEEASGIIVFNSGFTRQYLLQRFPEFETFPMLDALPFAKFVERRLPFPQVAMTKTKTSALFAIQTIIEQGVAYVRGGYTLDNLCDRVLNHYDGDSADSWRTEKAPKLERQPYRLYALWRSLLEQGE